MDDFYQGREEMKIELKKIFETIGQQIRNKRKAKSLTLEDLAEKCGREWSYISQIERGKSIPSIETLFRICNALEISLTDLFKVHKPVTYKPDSLTQKLINLVKDRPPKKKKIVYNIVQQILKMK
ncbi:MAG: helix-turn-helix transcriptional regulator [Elusimicrobiota bacterium]|nr:helix-turn-helix transcriptional regulator [Elusimicrobiota bacterium]